MYIIIPLECNIVFRLMLTEREGMQHNMYNMRGQCNRDEYSKTLYSGLSNMMQYDFTIIRYILKYRTRI